ARLRARLDALESIRTVARSIMAEPPEPGTGGDEPASSALEEALEMGRHDEARAALDRQEPAWAGRLARGIVGDGTGGRPGYLVFNPVGIPRRVPVLLPDAAPDLRAEG